MKKLFIFLCTFSLFLISCKKFDSNKLSFSSMDTIMNITSFGKNSKIANQLAQKEIYDIENLLSTTKTNSQVYELNLSNQTETKLSNHTFFVLDFSLKMAQKTDGAFNPLLYPIIKEWGFTTGKYKVPSNKKINELLQSTDYTKVKLNKETNTVKLLPNMMLDFGGIAKGYAGDCAIQILIDNGINSAILDLGGNIQTLGTKPDGSLWKIGIKNPWNGDAVISLQVQNKAIITSAGYERFFEQDGKKYIHIFDSKTGYPIQNNIASVTIICEKGIYADALSTSLYALGLEKAIQFYKQTKDFDFIILTNDKELYYSKGLKNTLTPLYPFTKEVIVE